MTTNRKQLIKDKFILKEIRKSIDPQMGISVIHIYHSSDICEDYFKSLKEIYKITYPILTTKKKGGEKNEYIEYLYKYLNLSMDNCHWLIPYFMESNWWIEIEIIELDNFINCNYSNSSSINITVYDINNNILFDIENGEDNYEYRVIKL